MKSQIEFEEDKSILSAIPSEQRPPETGFEGWFYKKIPGSYFVKRMILILFIVLLFSLSFILVVLGRYNLKKTNEATFDERIKSIRLK